MQPTYKLDVAADFRRNIARDNDVGDCQAAARF
jgi:hypothetical protein